MAYSKAQLLQAAIDAASEYPTVQQFVQARDPRVLAQLEAQATMLAMLSEQLDVAKFEPFLKARDSTVLADASLKGILPLGRACKLTLTVENPGTADVVLAAQRRLVDARGRLYELDSAVTIAAGGTASVTATQLNRYSVSHEVVTPLDFYGLPVTLSSADAHLNTISVYMGASEFRYAPDWFNVGIGELAYQMEVDELRRMSVKFGKKDVIGYGVQQGDVFTLDITECSGRITDLQVGVQFTLEYILAPEEATLKAAVASVQDEGAAPHTMAELRVMARYPAVYDHNAVYLGNFTFLLRRYLSGIRFLSVWNEQVEESVRGYSEDNINTLFVSGLVSGMSNAVFEQRVSTLIRRADDSYKVEFVAASPQAVPVTITASVAISWDLATVTSQIRSLILERYGDGSVFVSQGMEQPIKKAMINRILRENIDALRDEKAEFDVQITLPATPLPEHFLHITPASLTVNVSSVEYGVSLWNY